MQYSNTSYNWRSCLPCTALPYSRTAAWPQGSRHSMFALFPQCGDTSLCLGRLGLPDRLPFSKPKVNWLLHARSAFRRTPSLKKSAFLEAGSWVGVFSVFSRSSLGVLRQGIRDVKESAILTNSTFWWLGVLRFILGSSLVHPWLLTRMIKGRYKGRDS